MEVMEVLPAGLVAAQRNKSMIKILAVVYKQT